MRRVVLWGMLAVLSMPVLAVAQEQPTPPQAGSKAEPAAPAGGAVFEYSPAQLTAPVTVAQKTEYKELKYWIGLSCAPIDETLRSQLGLADGGLVIRQVAENSPAKVAGLAIHDIITEVKIGDKTHKPADLTQLTALVQQAEEKPLTFVLLRQGKVQSIAVTPKDRFTAILQAQTAPALAGDPRFVDANQSYFRLAGPVLSLRATHVGPVNLPDDITVVITKSGSGPVEITVRQKDHGEWKLKEKESAAQPEQINQAVISVLGYLSRLGGHIAVRDGQQVFSLEPGPHVNFSMSQLGTLYGPETKILSRTSITPPPVAVPFQKLPTLFSMQQRLDEIQKQQEQVTKALEELRQEVRKSQPQE